MWTESLEDILTDRQTGILWSPWQGCKPCIRRATFKQNWSQVRLDAAGCIINVLPPNKVNEVKQFCLLAWSHLSGTGVFLSAKAQAVLLPPPQLKRLRVPLGSGPQCHMPVNEKRILITNKLIKNQGEALLYRHNNLFLSKQELSSRITLTDPLRTFALLNLLFCRMGRCSMKHQRFSCQ